LTVDQFRGVDKKNKTPNFRYGFCESVMRTQGLTLEREVNILEAELMNRQQIVTAVGRFRTLKHIGLDIDDWNDPCGRSKMLKQIKIPQDQWDLTYQWKRQPTKSTRHQMEHQKRESTVIYEIEFSDGDLYRGYTTNTKEQRLEEHREKGKLSEKLATTSATITQLDSFTILHTQEALDVEKRYIRNMPFDRCLNTQHRPDDPDEQNDDRIDLVFQAPK
jgi:predicted GIY-YIG superfamily endonuclease